MNFDDLSLTRAQEEEQKVQIGERMDALTPKLWNLFRNLLYYSSDDEVDLTCGLSGRVFRIKFAENMGIEVYEIVKKKKLFKSEEYYDHVYQITSKEEEGFVSNYNDDSPGQLAIAARLVIEYLAKHFADKKRRGEDILDSVKTLESIVTGDILVNENI